MNKLIEEFFKEFEEYTEYKFSAEDGNYLKMQLKHAYLAGKIAGLKYNSKNS